MQASQHFACFSKRPENEAGHYLGKSELYYKPIRPTDCSRAQCRSASPKVTEHARERHHRMTVTGITKTFNCGTGYPSNFNCSALAQSAWEFSTQPE